jgi:hypothetical protein
VTAPTITWTRGNTAKTDDAGVCWTGLALPGGAVPKLYGGWAEPADEYGFYAGHYSCTPTSAYGHNSENVVPVGCYLDYNPDTDIWALIFGFTNPSGRLIRAHLWTAN